jgi:hypothetical protein
MRKLIVVLLLSLVIVPAASAKNMYVPVAQTTPGLRGTIWRTDVRVLNPSTTRTIAITLSFLPQGMDGTNIGGRQFAIAPGGVLVVENVVVRLWPHVTNATGAIRIDSDTDADYEFIASARTYVNSDGPKRPGTIGQFVPALDPDTAKRNAVILNVAERPDMRTSIGAMNPGLAPATLRVRVMGADGSGFLERDNLVVPPRSMQQWSLTELFGGLFAGEAYVVVEATQPLFTWGSIMDNYSGDPMFVPGIEPAFDVRPLDHATR